MRAFSNEMSLQQIIILLVLCLSTKFYWCFEDDNNDEQLGDFEIGEAFDEDFETFDNLHGVKGEDTLKDDILQDYQNLDVGKRNFNSDVTLGYVTPWNNHGYDVAKWAAQKFTHISPVWFQLKSAGSHIEDAPLFCQITGTHDIDSGWMDDIRKNNSKVKIVPRFLFEAWPVEDLKKFLYSEEVQRRCVKDIVRLLQRNQMDGAVIEIWVQIMSMTRGSAVEYLLEIIESWSKEFHKAGLEFILPMMPALDANYEETGIVNREVMRRLMSSVDYLNVMTYDYNSPQISGVAPYDWVKANLQYFIDSSEDYLESSTKILMGLNFYGYDRSGSSSEAVLSKKFIEILSDGDSVLSFDENDGEHKLIFGKYGIIYYPTKQSIKLRLNLAIELGIGGVAIWDLGQVLHPKKAFKKIKIVFH